MMKRLRLFAVAAICLLSATGIQAQANKGAKAGAKKPKPKEIAPAVNVYFGFNKSVITSAEAKKLDQLVTDLKSKKEYNLLLTGHTDSTGNDDYNLELSKDRVSEVYEYLQSKGIDSSVLKTNYFGRSKPAIKGKQEEADKMNRRVEITIYEPEKVIPPPPPPAPKTICDKDTTISLGSGIYMTLNACESRNMLSYKNPITIKKTSGLEDIWDAGVPLTTKKKDGLVWSGIFDVKFACDTCLKSPATFSFNVPAEENKKTKFYVYDIKDDVLEQNKKVTPKTQKTKNGDIKVNVPVKKDGQVVIAGPQGKSGATKFKDKTGNISEIYLTSNTPTTIIPAVRDGKNFYFFANAINEPKLILKMKDGETVIKDLDVSSIKKSKDPKKLRKKYKIKKKHLTMGAASSASGS